MPCNLKEIYHIAHIELNILDIRMQHGYYLPRKTTCVFSQTLKQRLFQDAAFVEFYKGSTFTTTWIDCESKENVFFKKLCFLRQSFF